MSSKTYAINCYYRAVSLSASTYDTVEIKYYFPTYNNYDKQKLHLPS